MSGSLRAVVFMLEHKSTGTAVARPGSSVMEVMSDDDRSRLSAQG